MERLRKAEALAEEKKRKAEEAEIEKEKRKQETSAKRTEYLKNYREKKN